MPSLPRQSLPILAAILGLGTYGVMDGFMKAAAIAAGAYSATFFRNMIGAGIMAGPWLWRARSLPGPDALRIHALRGAVTGVMAVLFFYGLARTPMAEAMGLTFTAPLVALYLAAALLHEPVGGRAIAGSLLALGGVGVIAQGKFTGAYDAESVKGLGAILVSSMLYAVNLVLQRKQAQLAAPQEIAFFQALFVTAFLGLGAPLLAHVPSSETWGYIVAGAALAGISQLLLSWAYARAEAQVLVPMEYTAFVWAALVGWIGFAEPLTWRTLAGVALIVAGCLHAARKVRVPA
ncbi:DMT family transporter [Novosphingobium sp. ZN18A2]|uniref:DMT family transporter n=1 Tax=Novosphingobium sp. ZN18A2 TaxID=3079861 RepID=UPI0030D2BC7D